MHGTQGALANRRAARRGPSERRHRDPTTPTRDPGRVRRKHWHELRHRLEQRRHARTLRSRFRRTPQTYLAELEQAACQPTSLRYGWEPRRKRLVDAAPHDHWRTTTFITNPTINMEQS